MDKKTLKVEGVKIGEKDFYDGMAYLFTKTFWAHSSGVYVSETHSNGIRYTGKNDTYQIAGRDDVKNRNEYYFFDHGMDQETYNDMVNYYNKEVN